MQFLKSLSKDFQGTEAGSAPASRARKTEHNTLGLWRLR